MAPFSFLLPLPLPSISLSHIFTANVLAAKKDTSCRISLESSWMQLQNCTGLPNGWSASDKQVVAINETLWDTVCRVWQFWKIRVAIYFKTGCTRQVESRNLRISTSRSVIHQFERTVSLRFESIVIIARTLRKIKTGMWKRRKGRVTSGAEDSKYVHRKYTVAGKKKTETFAFV